MSANIDETQDLAFEMSVDDILKSASDKKTSDNTTSGIGGNDSSSFDPYDISAPYGNGVVEGSGSEESTNGAIYDALDTIKEEGISSTNTSEEQEEQDFDTVPRKGKREREAEREIWEQAQMQRAQYENAAHQLSLENAYLKEEINKNKVSSYDHTLNEINNKISQTENLIEEAIDSGDSRAQARYYKEMGTLASYQADMTLNKEKYIVPDQAYYPDSSYATQAPAPASYQMPPPQETLPPATPEFREFLERNPYLNPSNPRFKSNLMPIAEEAYNKIELGYEINGNHNLIGSRDHMNLVEQEIKNQLGFAGGSKNNSTRGFGTRPAGLPVRRDNAPTNSVYLNQADREWAANGGVSGKDKNERIRNLKNIRKVKAKLAGQNMKIMEEIR